MYFIDTSALVKAYISEPPGTRTVLHAFQALGGSSLYVSSLVAAEALGVMARELRKGNLTPAQFKRLRDDLANHQSTILNVVQLTDAFVQRAFELIDTHRQSGVGPVDMIHLATAEYLRTIFPQRPLGFMCSDGALKSVVATHGMGVFDPGTDPLSDLLPPD